LYTWFDSRIQNSSCSKSIIFGHTFKIELHYYLESMDILVRWHRGYPRIFPLRLYFSYSEKRRVAEAKLIPTMQTPVQPAMLHPIPEQKVPRLPPMKKVVMKMVFTRLVAYLSDDGNEIGLNYYRICLFLYLQYPVHFMLYEWAFLALQEYTGFQTFQPMPYVLGDVHAVGSALLTDDA